MLRFIHFKNLSCLYTIKHYGDCRFYGVFLHIPDAVTVSLAVVTITVSYNQPIEIVIHLFKSALSLSPTPEIPIPLPIRLSLFHPPSLSLSL